MKTSKFSLMVATAALIAACSSGKPSASDASLEAATPETEGENTAMEATRTNATTPAKTTQELFEGFQENQPYAEFRKLAMGNGWMPLSDAQCKVNVIGANHDELCAGDSPLATCKVCDELPELSSCSGDGNCLVRFTHPNETKILEATGYGDITDWKTTGSDAAFRVSSWELAARSAE